MKRKNKRKVQMKPAMPEIAKPVGNASVQTVTHPKADTQPVIEINGLEHQLRDPESGDTFTLCIDKPLTIHAGSFTTILGPSGCGKTTLLTLVGLLRKPSKPKEIKTFRIYGDKMYDLADLWYRGCERQIEKLRRQFIGFALQSGELLSSLTVSENIAVPLRLNGAPESQCKKRVAELLNAFELGGEVKGNRLAHARINNSTVLKCVAESHLTVYNAF